MADDKPIIVIKKKGGHGGHHGGAWKVAYADFVTAMMAFFLVMWLVNSADVQTKQNIAQYFKRPGLFSSGSGTPLLIGESGILSDSYSPQKGFPAKNTNLKSENREKPLEAPPKEAVDRKRENPSGLPEHKVGRGGMDKGKEKPFMSIGTEVADEKGRETKFKSRSKAAEQARLEGLAEQVQRLISSSKELEALLGLVDVKVDADTLTIEIMDTEKSSMFNPGSARVRFEVQSALMSLAAMLKDIPAKTIDVIGHTDSSQYADRSYGYTNWELSSDRANNARKILQQGGIDEDRIGSVVGKAASEPRNPNDPMDPANRRITLTMHFDPADNSAAQGSSILDQIMGTASPQGSPTVFPSIAPNRVFPSEGAEDTSSAEPSPTESPSMTPSPQPTRQKKAREAAFIPTRKIQAKKQFDTVKLPNKEPPKENPPFMPEDKIFGDRPVIGNGTPFINGN